MKKVLTKAVCGVVFYLGASREGTETSRKVRRNRAGSWTDFERDFEKSA